MTYQESEIRSTSLDRMAEVLADVALSMQAEQYEHPGALSAARAVEKAIRELCEAAECYRAGSVTLEGAPQ
jgi:hypothetical protein